MKTKFKYAIFILVHILTFTSIKAQESAIIVDSVFSKVLSEQRYIKIHMPEEYVPGSTAKFDVVYILDGEAHFNDFLYIYKFARNHNFIPPLILISVPNTYTREGNMRDRDFTPEKTPDNAKSGGADNFITYFKDELIPYISKKLPVSGDNSVFGHSLGGLFTMYVLLKEPGLFSSYYCSDPAIPWNNRRILSMTEETFRNTVELNKSVWIIAVEETYKNVGIQKMDSVLQSYAPHGLRWKTSVYPNETHMSVRLKGIYDGLKYTYDGYNSNKLVEFHPNNGSLLEGKPVPVFLNGSFLNVHYTTDGSEPEESSNLAPQMIEITGPAELRVKWIGENEKYITTAKGTFELSKVWPAMKDIKNLKPGGMHYTYYEGKWEALPEFSKLKAVKTGIADSSFSFDNLPAGKNFGCVFEGYLKIEKEDYYAFALSSSDGSKLFINDREIINNDGLHGSDWYKSYVVPLQTGYYPVRIEYFTGEGNHHMDLIYISPGTYETVNVTFKSMYYLMD
jgi:predicted alpha/beta superfamily hydrolase